MNPIYVQIIQKGFLQESRCMIEGFNRNDDVDPKSKKTGVRCHNRVTAFFLKLFGKIAEVKNSDGKIVYLNKNSLIKWLARNSKFDTKVKNFSPLDALNKFINERRDAATKIQALVRGRQTRQRLQRQNEAAIKIQAWVRGHRDRKEFLRKKEAATRIQAWVRGYPVREEFLRKKEAATKIQALGRGYLVREEAKRRRAAIVKIQALFRGHLTRKHLEEEARAWKLPNFRGIYDQGKRRLDALYMNPYIEDKAKCKYGIVAAEALYTGVQLGGTAYDDYQNGEYLAATKKGAAAVMFPAMGLGVTAMNWMKNPFLPPAQEEYV